MAAEIRSEVGDDIARVTVANPGARNALTEDMMAALGERVTDLGHDDAVRVLIVRGAGTQAFCAGVDVSAFGDGKPLAIEDGVKRLLERVESVPIPTIAQLNGHAVGAGFELAAACDLRVAARETKLGITPAKMGIVLNDRAIRLLLNILGPTSAKELLYTGELIDADRAADIGFLNDVVTADELVDRTDRMAETIAANAPLSLEGMKSIIREIETADALDPAEKAWVRGLQADAFDSHDHREGREAFQEDRSPEFRGR